MEVRKGSGLYKAAYWWREHLDMGVPSEQTNLCRFFWSVITGVTVGPMCVAVIYCIFFLIAFVCTIFGFFFGYRPNFWDEAGSYNGRYYRETSFMIPMRILPVWGGHQLKPIYLMCAGLAAWATWWGIRWFLLSGSWRSALSWLFGASVGAILGALSLRFLRSEAWILTKAFFRAKKQGVCPVVTFIVPEVQEVPAEQ